MVVKGRWLNGWRRLWIIASAAIFIGLAGVWPLSWLGRTDYSYRTAIAAEFGNGKCAEFMSKPARQLVEPPFDPDGRGCWHIYTSRRYARSDIIPYTLEVYDDDKASEARSNYLLALGFGALGAALASAALYGVGALVAWVRRGFAAAR